jgi:hypothetical protein
VCAKVKKLRKAFAREEKRRKELPLELKQKVSREILQRLRDLGENRNTTEQRGLYFFFLPLFDLVLLVVRSYLVDLLPNWNYCSVHLGGCTTLLVLRLECRAALWFGGHVALVDQPDRIWPIVPLTNLELC